MSEHAFLDPRIRRLRMSRDTTPRKAERMARTIAEMRNRYLTPARIGAIRGWQKRHEAESQDKESVKAGDLRAVPPAPR